ncbi:MAG TPA: hypothetical protein VIM87_01840 [Chitinophaga sp.]|uniref:hypothetical protein n=1 Tax=Chitinophaga sp. TaxID=1869181 RepID=UPI002F947993
MMKKKIILWGAASLAAIPAIAQPVSEPLIDRALVFDVVNICGIILALYVVSRFIVTLVQLYLDSRLKTRMLDAGTPETVITQLLQQKLGNGLKAALQWGCVLASLAAGLAIIYFMGPVTLLSVAVLAGSIAVGLLAYYLLSKRNL